MKPVTHFLAPGEGRQLHVLQDTVRVLVDGAMTAGQYEIFVVEGPAGSGPPPHFHPWDEAIYLLEGEAELVVDGTSRRLLQGGFTLAPRGTVHSYTIISDRARFLVMTSKAGAARFFTDLDRETGAAPDFGKVVEIAMRNQVRLGG